MMVQRDRQCVEKCSIYLVIIIFSLSVKRLFFNFNSLRRWCIKNCACMQIVVRHKHARHSCASIRTVNNLSRCQGKISFASAVAANWRRSGLSIMKNTQATNREIVIIVSSCGNIDPELSWMSRLIGRMRFSVTEIVRLLYDRYSFLLSTHFTRAIPTARLVEKQKGVFTIPYCAPSTRNGGQMCANRYLSMCARVRVNLYICDV